MEDIKRELYSEIFDMNEIADGARGGTEMMQERLVDNVDHDLLKQFYIIPSRVRRIHPDKPNIFWCHDLANDPEVANLAYEEFRNKFAMIVFVSHIQALEYAHKFGLKHSEYTVIPNAIVPFEEGKKPEDDVVRVIYHTTPHRGLELLVPSVQKIAQVFPNIHLDVYSSFSVYSQPGRDNAYQELFEHIKSKPDIMTYHGGVSNDEVREALKKANIFGYPSIWPETSCLAAIEAMSAGCLMVSPNYGALVETVGEFGVTYDWHEDVNVHINRFANMLYSAVKVVKGDQNQQMLALVKRYVDMKYNVHNFGRKWSSLLKSLV